MIEAAGRIKLGTETTALRELVQELLDGGRSKLLLNLGEVHYIDSSGIGELVAAYTSALRRGGCLKLARVTPRVMGVLSTTQLYSVFEVFDNVKLALASFAPPPAATTGA